MSHDMNGARLRVGDKVALHCVIESIQPRFSGSEDPCDVVLALIAEPSPGAPRTRVTVRGKQIEIIGAPDSKPPLGRPPVQQLQATKPPQNGQPVAPVLVTTHELNGSIFTETADAYRRGVCEPDCK